VRFPNWHSLRDLLVVKELTSIHLGYLIERVSTRKIGI
jgi:hypothetical protein